MVCCKIHSFATAFFLSWITGEFSAPHIQFSAAFAVVGQIFRQHPVKRRGVVHFPEVRTLMKYHQLNKFHGIHCQMPGKIQFFSAVARAETAAGAIDIHLRHIKTEPAAVFFQFGSDQPPGMAAVKCFEHKFDRTGHLRRGKQTIVLQDYHRRCTYRSFA